MEEKEEIEVEIEESNDICLKEIYVIR